jgi:hypothetical protein
LSAFRRACEVGIGLQPFFAECLGLLGRHISRPRNDIAMPTS